MRESSSSIIIIIITQLMDAITIQYIAGLHICHFYYRSGGHRPECVHCLLNYYNRYLHSAYLLSIIYISVFQTEEPVKSAGQLPHWMNPPLEIFWAPAVRGKKSLLNQLSTQIYWGHAPTKSLASA